MVSITLEDTPISSPSLLVCDIPAVYLGGVRFAAGKPNLSADGHPTDEALLFQQNPYGVCTEAARIHDRKNRIFT